jgi:peptidoglycan/xylan/chitin deacetylase (PgdA/CDA1 family)
MRLDRELSLHLMHWLKGDSRKCLPILMYHSVSDDEEDHVHPYYRTCTSRDRFSEQMEWLRELGYRGVSLQEALATGMGQPNGRAAVAITFDDGFRNVFTDAWPVLRRHNFTATMYLPTAFISEHRKSWFGRECLTWEEVCSLRKEGAEFGSHTVSHPTLYAMPWEQIQNELINSKAEIEGHLLESISTFAYPFAFPQEDPAFAQRLVDIMRRSGYRSCVTTIIGRRRLKDDPLLLKRLPINQCDDKRLFLAKLRGAYDWMGGPQRLMRQAKVWVGSRL